MTEELDREMEGELEPVPLTSAASVKRSLS